MAGPAEATGQTAQRKAFGNVLVGFALLCICVLASSVRATKSCLQALCGALHSPWWQYGNQEHHMAAQMRPASRGLCGPLLPPERCRLSAM